MLGQIRYDPFKISRGPLSFLTLFLSVLPAAPNRERSRALTVAARPISIRWRRRRDGGRRRRRRLLHRHRRRAVRASTLKFRSGALWPLRGGTDTARHEREGEREKRRARGRGAVVMPAVSLPWKWKWRGTPPHRPDRARFIPGKTRENRHLLRYLLSLGVPTIERIYTGRSIYTACICTLDHPPPSPVHPHHLTPSDRAVILYNICIYNAGW